MNVQIRISILFKILLCSLFSVNAQDQIYGDFILSESKDLMTDELIAILVTKGMDQDSRMALRCRGDIFNIIVSPGEFKFVTSREPVEVRYRFDKDEPSDWVNWFIDTEGTSLFVDNPVKFAKKAVEYSSILIRYRDHRGTSHDLQFSLRGLTDGINLLHCYGEVEEMIDQYYSHVKIGMELTELQEIIGRGHGVYRPQLIPKGFWSWDIGSGGIGVTIEGGKITSVSKRLPPRSRNYEIGSEDMQVYFKEVYESQRISINEINEIIDRYTKKLDDITDPIINEKLRNEREGWINLLKIIDPR